MGEALQTILDNKAGMFTLADQKIAHGLQAAVRRIQHIDEVTGPLAFRIHPKGTGVICKNPSGI
jgi:hypothetical protein